ncbi:hypothetical protein ACHAXT_002933 [Thalassiosira profunda]
MATAPGPTEYWRILERLVVTMKTFVHLLAVSLLVALAGSMQIARPHTARPWCERVVNPEWPFAYSKYQGQREESKGRVSTNKQDVRHECDVRGVQSKCHVCEAFACGPSNDQTCHFQLQGVASEELSVNIPTVSDVPWAVNGSHRYDFGGESATHVCMYLSGAQPCQSSFGNDYSNCELRCWGYGDGMSGANSKAAFVTAMEEEELDGTWPNHRIDSRQGVNSTPWEQPSPTMAWNYPRFGDGDEVPTNPIEGKNFSYNPQGFVFTLAGSLEGEEGFVDGTGSGARFRHPEGVAVDHDGYAYVADTGNHAIRMISPGGKVTTLVGTGTPGSTDGLAVDGVQFSSPTDIAVWRDWAWWPYPNPIDPDSFLYRNGNGRLALFVADTGNHRVRKITGDTGFDPDSGEKVWSSVKVECFAGRCDNNPESGYADGTRAESSFDAPRGITASSEGNVFVADTNNHRIRMIDQFGVTTTIAGAEDTSTFNYPSSVALESDEVGVLVTDRHRIQRVNLDGGAVTALIGGYKEGSRDGDGTESNLNNPASIAITGDGVGYIADSATCRIRQVRSASSVAAPVSCTAPLPAITRPNGCSSYNFPIDEYGLAATSVEGNINHNYQYRQEFDVDLGHDFIGRSLKNCVGSPPISWLDKRRWNETTSSYPFNYNLVVDDNQTRIKEDPNDGTRITVRCDGCSVGGSFDAILVDEAPRIQAANAYSEESSVCAAALNEGVLSDDGSGLVDVTIISEDRVRAYLDRTASQSKQYFVVSESSQEMRLQTIAGAPASLRGQSCGYLDSFPPQSSKFYHPSGLGAFVNASLDDATRFLFIADRDNHAIRGMSAACSFTCENGGRCVGPDQCQCPTGWEGLDCTKPVCEETCGQRELCVDPDTCECIPGYRGEGCLEATCVQECQNGHCSAPDVCSCDPGWFDSNCTTPVCEQTCGNGGNCTGPNTCTCPTDFTGIDCRTPVCEQTCSNGGWCVAPNTCQCPPSYSGFDCNMPVCHQGFFVPSHELPEWMSDVVTESHWLEYQPCNYTVWCDETNGFDCAQRDRSSSAETPLFGPTWRHRSGRKGKPDVCMMLELADDAVTHFQYISAWDNSSTSHHRYTPHLPYDWLSQERLPWNAYDEPGPQLTQPYQYLLDRQIALATYRNVTQGAYMCANGGRCVSPDVCSCGEGWIGFDCRVPVCEQGYYEPDLESFSEEGLGTFAPFLDPSRPYNLDSSRDFSSNPDVSVEVERFINGSSVERTQVVVDGSQYLAGNESETQGGYECSIRSVTQWEDYRSGFILDHPNYYSRYMDEKVEDDGLTYTHWKGMGFPPTHRKTAKLVKYDDEFMQSGSSTSNQSYVYTNVGHMKDGVWRVTGASWQKGHCVVQFERRCQGEEDSLVPLVPDTDESYRPQITYDDQRAHIDGRWFASANEVCVDHVVRGCYNNGTCVAPNTCSCAEGWSGHDCSVPVCEQTCLHNGNCTHPNVCTCERGWSGPDCSVALCAQECNNGGNGRTNGETDAWEAACPLFQKPNGDPQLTGWTGYDCSTPTRAQLLQTTSSRWEKATCSSRTTAAFYQSGCGWDVLETGCCYEVDEAYTCFRCEGLLVSDHNATCAAGSLEVWQFESLTEVPLTLRTFDGDVRKCGPSIEPDVAGDAGGVVTATSNLFLCNVWQWEQGDFIDDAGLGGEEGVGADFGLKAGRHIRVNYNNYQRSDGDPSVWTTGPAIPGEGVFRVLQRRELRCAGHMDTVDSIAARRFAATSKCRERWSAVRTEGSASRRTSANASRRHLCCGGRTRRRNEGLTGWAGSDCSMPMCTQGYFDPDCNATAAPGGEGCYRCANGGICVGPDLCQCAEGWSGYDCRTPVCAAEATPLVRKQLKTNDERKLRIFEEDPCGMVGFNSLHSEGPRGVCTAPNVCTCSARDRTMINSAKGWADRIARRPWHDPLFRRRNALAPNEVFGTRNCYSGWEGVVNEDDLFGSCHLRIKEPSTWERHTRAILWLSVLGGMVLIYLLGRGWRRATRIRIKQTQERRQERLSNRQLLGHNTHAFAYNAKKRK